MKKPVKIVVRVLIGLVALVVLVLLGALFFIDSLVKTAVEKGGTHAAGVPVTLSSADVKLGSSGLDLAGFAIQNPPQFRPEPFLGFGKAHASWDQSSIFSDSMVIQELTIEDVTINLEHTNGKTNFGSILDHLGAGDAAPKDPPSSAKRRTLIVKHILVTNVKAAVHMPGLAENSAGVTVPRIELKDFRSDGTTTEIVAALTKTLVDALLTSTLDAGSANMPKEIAKSLERQVDSLKSQAESVLKDVEGVKDIFKKRK